MGLKQIPTKIFLLYLTEVLGLVCIRNEGTSHFVFDYPPGHVKGKLPRPLIVWVKEKEIPLMHIHTNLRTIDPLKGKKVFEEWYNVYTGKSKKKK